MAREEKVEKEEKVAKVERSEEEMYPLIENIRKVAHLPGKTV